MKAILAFVITCCVSASMALGEEDPQELTRALPIQEGVILNGEGRWNVDPWVFGRRMDVVQTLGIGVLAGSNHSVFAGLESRYEYEVSNSSFGWGIIPFSAAKLQYAYSNRRDFGIVNVSVDAAHSFLTESHSRNFVGVNWMDTLNSVSVGAGIAFITDPVIIEGMMSFATRFRYEPFALADQAISLSLRSFILLNSQVGVEGLFGLRQPIGSPAVYTEPSYSLSLGIIYRPNQRSTFSVRSDVGDSIDVGVSRLIFDTSEFQ